MKINIAIDGLSACGKSTLAKALAKALDYTHIDSGAMYRAVALFAVRHNISLEDLPNRLHEIKMEFSQQDGKPIILLNGENVTEEIRSKAVNNIVSEVAALSPIRKYLVSQQQAYARNGGVVMDGRDIGTVVMSDAHLKLFIVSDIQTRTHRRYEEVGGEKSNYDLQLLKENLIKRDRIDSTRKDSPLKKADDAIEIDNTNLNREEQLELCLQYFNARVKRNEET